jgi:hypothetical protein
VDREGKNWPYFFTNDAIRSGGIGGFFLQLGRKSGGALYQKDKSLFN